MTSIPDPIPTPEENVPAHVKDSPKDSYVKLAMRNMVRKGKTSLLHFSLTVIALMGVLVGLAVVFH